jgi:hypothetical protein
MPKKLPSIEYLHKALRYEPSSGEFFWRKRTPDMFLHKGALSTKRKCDHWNSKHADTQAFTAGKHTSGNIDGAQLLASHVAWALSHDVWPREEGIYIRHKSGNKSDNRLRNLIPVSPSDSTRANAPRGSAALGARIEATIQRHIEDMKEALEWQPDPSRDSGSQSD